VSVLRPCLGAVEWRVLAAKSMELDRPCTERAIDYALDCVAEHIAAHDGSRSVLAHGDVRMGSRASSGPCVSTGLPCTEVGLQRGGRQCSPPPAGRRPDRATLGERPNWNTM